MPKPNNIYKNSFRKLTLCVEEIVSTEKEANEYKEFLQQLGIYHMVKLSRFKTGARPNKYNGFKQHYDYAIRAYKKP